jgi:hypothetical protein
MWLAFSQSEYFQAKCSFLINKNPKVIVDEPGFPINSGTVPIKSGLF